MKRILATLLIIAACFSITACAGDSTSSAASNTDSVTSEAEKEESKDGTSRNETTTKPPETTTKAPETTTKPPETTTKPPETSTKAPETSTKAPETTTSNAPETEPPASSGFNEVTFTNLTTGEVFELYNDTAIYTQTDGWASFVLGGHDVKGEQGCSIVGEVVIDGLTCYSGSVRNINDSYKAPAFLVHLGSINGPVTIDNAYYPDNFKNSTLYIEYIDLLKEATFSMDITFIGGDGNTYRISGKGSAPFTRGTEPPERVYDETCTVCYGTGKCRGCNGTGWFSTVGDGIRCNSCYNYDGKCIGCDGHGKH